MKKRTIVIASVLKPVNDTRLFEKFATSLAREGHLVTLIGYPSAPPASSTNIRLHQLAGFSRVSLARVFAPLKVFQKTIEVKPEILIVTTHELLIVALLNRILFGTILIYDIQENYYQNIIWTNAFPAWLRWPLATVVRFKEKALSPFFRLFFLAEKVYEKELPFTAGKSVVLENKCLVPAGFKRAPNPHKITLVFTGTLAESTGVFEALQLAERLHQKDDRIELHLAGYCAQVATRQKLTERIAGKSFVRLTGGHQLVPHPVIMEAISNAHFGLVCYPDAPHTRDRIPTKLFEYLACELPILLQKNETWLKLANKVQGALEVDFGNPQVDALLAQLLTHSFYPSHAHPSDQFTWQAEEPKLIESIKKLGS